MDVTSSTLRLDTPDGKMETYEAKPKEGGAHPAVIVLMEAFGLNGHIKDVSIDLGSFLSDVVRLQSRLWAGEQRSRPDR